MPSTPATVDRDPRDPRPVIDEERLVGGRCAGCGYPMTLTPPRCPSCGEGPVTPTSFGPDGVVWTATVLRIPLPGRTPPIGLAYVDVDDGPRILAHVDGCDDEPLTPGTRVRIAGYTSEGDPLVAAVPTP